MAPAVVVKVIVETGKREVVTFSVFVVKSNRKLNNEKLLEAF